MNFAEGMAEALRQHASFAREEDAAAFWSEGAPRVPVLDLTYPGAIGQPQAVRFYRGTTPGPVLLYIHGGGWIGGSIAVNDPAVRALVAESGWSALSVSYRLAPADPFPAGLDDVRAALRWLVASAPALGLDVGQIAMGGASAGANLAVAAAMAEDPGCLAGLVLFYGLFGVDLDTPSYRAHADAPVLTRDRVAEILSLYDPEGRRDREPLIAPLVAPSLSTLPPAFLVVAEYDVLADDSRRMAARLAAEAAGAEVLEVAGVTHGFINRGRLVPAARDALTRAARFLVSLESAT